MKISKELRAARSRGGKVKDKRKGLGSMSPERRREIASLGGKARWNKGKDESTNSQQNEA